MTSASCSRTRDTDDGDESPEGAASRIARSRKQLANRKIEDLLKPGQTRRLSRSSRIRSATRARASPATSRCPVATRVFMPHVAQVGVSRRIGSDKERRRLRDLVNEARPKGSRLHRAHRRRGRERSGAARRRRLPRAPVGRDRRARGARCAAPASSTPISISRCASFATSCARTPARSMIDDEEQYDRVKKFTLAFLPRFAERIKKLRGPPADLRPLSHRARAPARGRRARSRCARGGSLVIDQGEALTAIDVNTGSFTNTGSGNLEDTVTAQQPRGLRGGRAPAPAAQHRRHHRHRLRRHGQGRQPPQGVGRLPEGAVARSRAHATSRRSASSASSR